MQPKITKIAPRDPPKWSKWSQNRYLNSSKNRKTRKSEMLWKHYYLLYFREVGTPKISTVSIQNSSKIVPAIQSCFLTPQITENIKKWPKMVSNGGPNIHQKSSKVHPGTLWGLPECIGAPLDHQNGLQRPPNGPKMVPWGSQKDRKINKIH